MKFFRHFLMLFSFCMLFLYSCKTEDIKQDDYDSKKPSVFTDYSPKEGSMRARLYIYGSNIPKDISRLSVSIGDRVLKVIGSDGTKLYCMVPSGTSSGEVSVKVMGTKGEVISEHTFADEFVYKATSTVGTLVGKVDEKGNSSIVDGDFTKAQFGYPSWLLYEPHTNWLFVIEADKVVRKVDIDKQDVSTLITNGQASFKKIQTASLSFDNDTLFIVDDNGQNNRNAVAIAYTLRSENFRRVYPYLYDRTSYSCSQHPVDHVMFFNTWWYSAINKAIQDPITNDLSSKELFRVDQVTNFKSTIIFHPSGNYAYILGNACIYKSNYNWQTKELESPIIFAGSPNIKGDIDGVGTSARFEFVYQGVFVKNPEYAGQADEYDFYLCDIDNHSIRYLTPRGEVTTFAGKGSPTPDGQKKGYIDGDLRKEARFNQPSGIAYDAEHKIFYITERTNKRIRTISIK